MSKSIRRSNPIHQAVEKLIDLASALPVGSEPREMADAMRFTLDLADRFNAAFTAQGWVFVEFCCGHEPAAEALAMKAEGSSPEEIDAYLADRFINHEPLYWQTKKLLGGAVAEPIHPVRVEVVERAFRAYREADFIACVPLLLMLIDGFGVTKTGTKSIFSDLADLSDLFESEASVGGHQSGLKAVLGQLIRTKKGYSEEQLTLPLRNGILHGTRLNYGSKAVAAKALCVLAAVIEWARDTATVPKDETARRKWNAQFLAANFARLKSTSPDEALGLLQGAFDSGRSHEAVAIIDYHPSTTNLQSKLSEWADLMATTKIQIARKGDWEVFGSPTNSEQKARCRVELIVRREEDADESRSDETLYAARQAAMKEFELDHVWQIGLPILGIIRSKFALT